MSDSSEDPKPKPRPLELEAHVLAYLGDFLTTFEESIRRIALSTLKHAAQSPGDQ
jgi:hypothetical protein